MSIFDVDENIAKAKTLHSDFYTRCEYFEAAKEKIFSNSWQFIGHRNLVATNGDCYPFILLEDYLNEPLVLTKENDTIHCLSNVCTHRGNLVINEPCKLSKLRCRYHGRLFKLDGGFHSMPEFKEVENFPTKDDDLKSLPLFSWGNWLFTSLNKKDNAGISYNQMIERLHWLPLHEFIFRPDLSKDYSLNANWALYCENYLEGFHIPFVHPALNAALDFGNYSTELYPYSSLQLGIAKDEEDCFDLPSSSSDFGKKIAAYYYFIFPNLMFNFYPWGLSVNVVRPVAIDKSIISYYTYVWKEDKLQSGAGADVNNTEMEDEDIVEAVQKGIRSRFYQHGRYSVKHETGTHHFHRLICEFMKE